MPPNIPLPIYNEYFQKSRTFLFPLLELARKGKDVFLPAQTYLGLKGLYKPYDHKLICSYDNPADNPAWLRYQQQTLLHHPRLETVTPVRDGAKLLYFFDLSGYAADIDLFLKGRYSQLSAEFRRHCCSYYGVQSPEWAQIEGFLYPDVAIPRYAKHLGYSTDDFRASLQPHGELCPVYDPVQETLIVDLPADFVEQLIIS